MFDSWVSRLACDLSYARTLVEGQTLGAGTIAGHIVDPVLYGYTVDFIFDDVETGFQAIAFRNAATGKLIMAMRGARNPYSYLMDRGEVVCPQALIFATIH